MKKRMFAGLISVVLIFATAITHVNAATFTFNGTITKVLIDSGSGTYSGNTVGDSFSGNFIFGDNTAQSSDIHTEPNERDWEFSGGAYGATITDGANSTNFSIVNINIQDDWPLDAASVDYLNSSFEQNVTIDIPVDTWSLTGVTDGAYWIEAPISEDPDNENLANGMTIHVAFVSYDTTLYSGLNYQPSAPDASDLALFAFEEADASGNTLFSAVGLLDINSVSFSDADNDSIADDSDNCPSIANASQEDADNDGVGDACDSLTTITGNVRYNDSPVCSMVLANGQYQFTCSGDGSFSLDVPLDNNGQITVYSFCSGLSPYKQVINPSPGQNISIQLQPGDDGDGMDVPYSADAISTKKARVSGTVTYNGSPVCAMALANGQYQFTCSEDGSFSLDVPLDNEGGITLYSFCSGRPPYKEIIISDQISTSVDLDGDGYSVATGDCNNLDSTISPVISEVCDDGIDQDCDGSDFPCNQDVQDYIGLWEGILYDSEGQGEYQLVIVYNNGILTGELTHLDTPSRKDFLVGSVDENKIWNFTMSTNSTDPDCVENFNPSGTAFLTNGKSALSIEGSGNMCGRYITSSGTFYPISQD